MSARPESRSLRSPALQRTFIMGVARHAFMPHIWCGVQFSGVRVQVGSSGCCCWLCGAAQIAYALSDPNPFWSGTGVIVARCAFLADVIAASACAQDGTPRRPPASYSS